MPVLKLEDISELKNMSGREYRDAWAWVHFMLHGPPEARLMLQRYLREIAEQRVPAPLSQQLASAVPNADQRMREHFLRWK